MMIPMSRPSSLMLSPTANNDVIVNGSKPNKIYNVSRGRGWQFETGASHYSSPF